MPVSVQSVYWHGMCSVSWGHLFFPFLSPLFVPCEIKLGALMINLRDLCFLCLGERCETVTLTAKLCLAESHRLSV